MTIKKMTKQELVEQITKEVVNNLPLAIDELIDRLFKKDCNTKVELETGERFDPIDVDGHDINYKISLEITKK